LVDLWTYRPEKEFEPTAASAAGGLLFLCGKDGRVRALDAVTGILKWSYQTAAPIMQPPTIWKGRAYVGSGDGYVYSVEAATGRLLWRYRAAPVERRIMAYGALCSTWPVNSGVLVEDGAAYAAAGIIDYDGTFVYALDARTGHPKWQNSISGHLNEEVRKGVSAQGNLTVNEGRLWMAGGNVISPACYDLKSGEYVGDMPTDGSPRANRGEEIGVLGDSCVVFGGRLRYSATENVVNPGSFDIAEIRSSQDLSDRKRLSSGRILGCWDSNHVFLVNGRGSAPVCFRTSDAEDYAQGDTDRPPSPLWTASLGDNTDVVALALAPNAAVAAYETKLIRTAKPPRWRVCVLDLEDGSPKWSWNLPAAPLPGGLLIDRDGRIVAVLQNGSVICFGDVSELLTQVDTFMALADEGGFSEEVAKSKLMDLLKVVHTSDTRPRVVQCLGKLGLNVGEQAERQGFITTWHLMGPVPWNDENPFDKVFVNEPKVDTAEPSVVGSKTLSWREYLTELPSAQVDLRRIHGESPYTAMYAYAEVDLPAEQDLLLKVGSDDGVLAWFNGQEVHRHDIMRGWATDQDVVRVKGKKGKNSILLKVSQGNGDWAFSARLTDRDNDPIDLRR
jgi:outer membrane protein assembly factor BamB